jgi:hypothetical protein
MNNQQQSSSLLMALAIIAATMLVSTVVVETLYLFNDAEAKKGDKIKEKDGGNHGSGGDNPRSFRVW